MALRPELEEKVRRAEELAKASDRRSAEISISIDEAISSSGEIAIPAEVWDDDSLVTHAAELRDENDRVKRESRPPPFARVADTRYAITNRK